MKKASKKVYKATCKDLAEELLDTVLSDLDIQLFPGPAYTSIEKALANNLPRLLEDYNFVLETIDEY